MRIFIAGAGNVGRSIARELVEHGHDVLLVDRTPGAIKPETVPGAEWLLADACELASLEEAGLESCDVAIAATGDDKTNLVHALLAKTEFAVPRTVGRVNHPGNEWMFDEMWGVDVGVSTPRIMASLVEEAVTVGELVPLYTFPDRTTRVLSLTLPQSSPAIGRRVEELELPGDPLVTAVVRDGRAMGPGSVGALLPGDELLLQAAVDRDGELTRALSPGGTTLQSALPRETSSSV